MDELIGNLMTYELKKKQENEIGGKRKEKNLVLTGTTPENFENENIALNDQKVLKIVKKRDKYSMEGTLKESLKIQ